MGRGKQGKRYQNLLLCSPARAVYASCLILQLALTLQVDMVAALHPNGMLLDEARAESDWITQKRWNLHQIPELAYKEEDTSAYLRAQLTELGIPFRYPVAETGIVATVGKGALKFALRSDIDALPIQEETGLPYASKTQGKMHACGHDAHMAMLLGAAKLLKAKEDSLPGTVLLLFQPAEEGGRGAKRMVEAGVMEGVSGVHGIHVWPELESGNITTCVGPIMAAGDRINITVTGSGGHGAIPHISTDSLVAAAALVGALQSLISRETSATDSAVLSITQIHSAPGQANIIPKFVTLGGTMRALKLSTLGRLRDRIKQVSEGVAATYDCTAQVEFSGKQGKPVINDESIYKIVKQSAEGLVGKEHFKYLHDPTMASEDFCYLADAAPGTFTFLGVRNESIGAVHGLHTPKFRMDDAQLALGAALHAAVALNFFEQHAADGHHGTANGHTEL